MAEYIKREAVLSRLRKLDCLCASFIERMPYIEAEPARHGRWVYEKTYQGMKYVCSECGELPECFEPNYCPNCGAKMDLKGEQKCLDLSAKRNF